MKPFLLLLFTALIIVSCKKETKSTNSALGNYITYDVDSVYADGDGSHQIQFVANDSTIDAICLENGLSYLDLNLGVNIAVGTYPLDSVYAPVLVYSDDVFNDDSHSISGSVTIASHDPTAHTISGTFYATVKQHDNGRIRVISNGKFQGHY